MKDANKMIYIIIYQDGMEGIVHSVHTDEEKAKKLVKKLNGNAIRYGTYEIHNANLDLAFLAKEKVYVVEGHRRFEFDYVSGVYSTKDKAEEARKKLAKKEDLATIAEFEVK